MELSNLYLSLQPKTTRQMWICLNILAVKEHLICINKLQLQYTTELKTIEISVQWTHPTPNCLSDISNKYIDKKKPKKNQTNKQYKE